MINPKDREAGHYLHDEYFLAIYIYGADWGGQ